MCGSSRFQPTTDDIVRPMSFKYYAHFLVDQPEPSLMQEYRGVVELDQQPSRGREFTEAVRIIARNLGRPSQDVKVLQWARLH